MKMNMSVLQLIVALLVGIAIGMLLRKRRSEGFTTQGSLSCGSCGGSYPCGGCPKPEPRPVCPPCEPCREPDMSKYVLRASIPPCPTCPDMGSYILKSEVPPMPDLSQYVLKSSIPKQAPVILDCSKCNKPKGDCPPCPRARCPDVKCPPATKCPACAPCPRAECPPAVVKCKAEEVYSDNVRPFLAPISYSGYGM
jgi:hypothetical protein